MVVLMLVVSCVSSQYENHGDIHDNSDSSHDEDEQGIVDS